MTDPPGFMCSTLATRLPGGWILESLIIGVLPMAARMSGWISIGGARVSHRVVHLRRGSFPQTGGRRGRERDLLIFLR